MNYSANEEDKILYISNPDKRKDCPLEEYDFDETVVEGNGPSGLLSWKDRNFINSHYHDECGEFVVKSVPIARKFGSNIELTDDNDKYYKEKLWPLGVVMYSADAGARRSQALLALRNAMTTIELSSCIVFHNLEDLSMSPRNFLWFSSFGGEVMPRLGVVPGNQSLLLSSLVNGVPGHTAHALNMLLRILGIPMMSNRYDRDNYVTVHWKNIQQGMEHYFERLPEDAMLRNSDGVIMQYDYTSVTHAPSNYLCADCSLGQQTVSPVQDHLWQRTLTMGHRTDLNPMDIEILNLLYAKECQNRFTGQDK
ncbi:unnamed protein product [Arctia plantaginis]|uniref:Metalloendopeptidase n=1 Tax=Arctia plantaginis TaxID=874455 RepID=A0A8S0ZX25_ARCPL|nr:unnamed protein product [Arctia plantaginis]